MQFNSISSVSIPTSAEISLRGELGRFVFDAMLELDLLGVMLSPRHFKLFLSKLDLEDATRLKEHALNIIECEQETASFHQFMLKMCSAVYIEECMHPDHESLMADLDEKCAALDLDTSELYDVDQDAIIEIEMAWRYRRFCSGSNTLAF